MDVVDFFRGYDVKCVIQEVFESERAVKSTFGSKVFHSRHLTATDCPHWLSEDHGIESMKSIPLPPHFESLCPWTIVENRQTDSQGWLYSRNFQDVWSSINQPDSMVRQRCWQRVIVQTANLRRARDLLPKFYRGIVLFRAMNHRFIDSALSKFHHQYQVIYENQRLHNDSYLSSSLLSDDPPPWSVQLETSQISLEKTPIQCPTGWTMLHDFIFAVHLDTDELGWEYSDSFSHFRDLESRLDENGSPSRQEVRRRTWFRTIVPIPFYSDCKKGLSKYITLQPRGTVKQGNLYKYSSYQQTWISCEITLNDRYLVLSSPHKKKSYDLVGMEVIQLRSHECIGYQKGFGIRKKALDNSVNNVLCRLTAESSLDTDTWIQIISHQVALINIDFFPLYFGPTIFDPVIIADDMWKRSDILHVWRLRSLELYRSGFLIYFHGAQMRDRLNINGCQVIPSLYSGRASVSNISTHATSPLLTTSPDMNSSLQTDEDPFFTIITHDGFFLFLKAMSVSIKLKWIQNLSPFTSSAQINSLLETSPDILKSFSSLAPSDEECESQNGRLNNTLSTSFRQRSYLRSPSPSTTQIYPEEIELGQIPPSRSLSSVNPNNLSEEMIPKTADVSWRLAKPKEV